MFDAKAEAEKRYRDDDLPHGWAPYHRETFLAGAVWALREFGDMLDMDGARVVRADKSQGLALLTWASEAHHIADRIEHGD